jgi:hypothetical protein
MRKLHRPHIDRIDRIEPRRHLAQCESVSKTVTRATMQAVDIPLDDGVYDAFVVWAETRDDGSIALDLTITTGAHKGEVVSVRATRATRDAIDLVGMPCTLRVRAGEPALEW